MSSGLEQLRKLSKVVADTGEVEAIRKYKPVDATTNPTLLLKAAEMKEYSQLVDDAIQYGRKHGKTEQEQITATMNKLMVNFGTEITKIVEGVVSTEVDARISFDVQASIERARTLIKLYEEQGVGRERILIKLASTWEGMCAAAALEKEGIHCNMTLMFSLIQAVAAAEAGATLVSPFVGRITDWHKEKEHVDGFPAEKDPGVLSVRTVYAYYKNKGYKTIVMGASFRNKEQILALAGCDKLTISPKLLQELEDYKGEVKRVLSPDTAKYDGKYHSDTKLDEKTFRWWLNEDAMATEKLSEGIRKFAADAIELEGIIRKKLGLK